LDSVTISRIFLPKFLNEKGWEVNNYRYHWASLYRYY